jgi:hypothetical protein
MDGSGWEFVTYEREKKTLGNPGVAIPMAGDSSTVDTFNVSAGPSEPLTESKAGRKDDVDIYTALASLVEIPRRVCRLNGVLIDINYVHVILANKLHTSSALAKAAWYPMGEGGFLGVSRVTFLGSGMRFRAGLARNCKPHHWPFGRRACL